MSDVISNPSRKPKLRFWRIVSTVIIYALVCVALVCVAGAFVGFLIYDHVMQEAEPGPTVELNVAEGMLGRDVGKQLAEQALIEHEGFFRLALQLDREGGTIRHGIYELPQGLSAMQYLKLLYKGPTKQDTSNQIRVTVPEGLTVAQAAALFQNPDAFNEAAQDPKLIAEVGIAAESLEGFLMPDTYFFDEQPTEREVVERMVEHFIENYEKLTAELSGSESFDKMTIVTVASLVEEEAKVEDERPLIAAVMYNRLDEGMPLQMDSTLQYALNKYGERLLDADKEVDSPYNTYKNKGLPPGPISSPGLSAIRAALAPSQEKYLYFVSNADGMTHTFSKTYKEHQAAVAKFRKEIAVQRAEEAKGAATQ